MFDIGFWEIILISIIGLVVLGPQRLPIAIRTVLKWVNTAKNMANSVKNEISQELQLHEMNEKMIKATKQGLDTLDPDLKASIDKMKRDAQDVTRPYEYDGDEAIQPHHTAPIQSEANNTETELEPKPEQNTVSGEQPKNEMMPPQTSSQTSSKKIPQQEK